MNDQIPLPLETGNALSRDAFVVAPGNAKPFVFLESWPNWPVSAVALFGPPASGKTHLAHIWAARSGAAVIAARDLTAPLTGPAVVEDIDGGLSPAGETALFAMLEAGGPLLLTAHTAPGQWPAGLPDLVSRYRALLSFELGAPDEALLLALAVKLFADRQLLVPENVVTGLVRGLERSPAALRDFIARADRLALSRQKPVNLQLIRALMENPDQVS
jgi:chromosomal replication initiation ATPase DnaA